MSLHLIDVHHHILPPRYVECVGAANIASQGSSGRVPLWSLAQSIDRMDKAGIAAAITSISAPGLAPMRGDPAPVARYCNDFAADMAIRHRGRFGVFATLPLPSITATLHEIAHCYDALAVDGVCLLSNYEGRYLGSAEFHPVYEELDRRGAVVFVHPTAPAALPDTSGLSLSTMEFPFDTTRTIASLILAGVPRRFPSIRFIFSHGGGAIPFLCERVDTLTRNNPKLLEQMPEGFAHEIRNFYLDCTLATSAAQVAAMRAVVGDSKILFGTDYPFGPPDQMLRATRAVSQSPQGSELSAGVLSRNTQQLFPRFFGDGAIGQTGQTERAAPGE